LVTNHHPRWNQSNWVLNWFLELSLQCTKFQHVSPNFCSYAWRNSCLYHTGHRAFKSSKWLFSWSWLMCIHNRIIRAVLWLYYCNKESVRGGGTLLQEKWKIIINVILRKSKLDFSENAYQIMTARIILQFIINFSNLPPSQYNVIIGNIFCNIYQDRDMYLLPTVECSRISSGGNITVS